MSTCVRARMSGTGVRDELCIYDHCEGSTRELHCSQRERRPHEFVEERRNQGAGTGEPLAFDAWLEGLVRAN